MIKHRKTRPNYNTLMTTSWYSKSLSGHYRKFDIFKVEIKCKHSACKHTLTRIEIEMCSFFFNKRFGHWKTISGKRFIASVAGIDFKSKFPFRFFFPNRQKLICFQTSCSPSIIRSSKCYPNITCNHRRGCATTYRKCRYLFWLYKFRLIFWHSLRIDNLDW